MSLSDHPQEQPDLASSTDEYARRFAGAVGAYFLEVQWQTLVQLLPENRKNMRILDVGGGHAQLAKPLVAEGCDVTVLGSDASCIPRLDREVGEGAYRFICGDLLSLPVDDNSYDIVLAFRLLPHLNSWQRFLGEITRVARDCVVFDYPDLRSVNWFGNQMFAAKSMVEENTRRFRCFGSSDVMNELTSNNVKQIELRKQFLFPMALHRVMKFALLSRALESTARAFRLTALFGSPVIVKGSFIDD